MLGEGGREQQLLPVQYSKLLDLLRNEGGCRDQSQPALKYFGKSLASLALHISGDQDQLSRFKGPQHLAGSFLGSLKQEAERLRYHASSTAEELWSDLLDVVQKMPNGVQNHGTHTMPLSTAEKLCDEIGMRLAALDAFVRISVATLAQLAEMKDTGEQLGPQPTMESAGEACGPLQDPIYTACFHAFFTSEARLEPILVGLSDAYEHIRRMQEGSSVSDMGDTAWEPPARFTRDTTKFWLRPKDAMQFRVELIKHLPLLLFGKREKLKPGADFGSKRVLREQTAVDWSVVNSVYFDDKELHCYMARLRRDDRATVMRVRWYGQRSENPSQEVFVERKVHREPWTGERSCKERCPIRQEELQPLMSGSALPARIDPSSGDGQFLQDVQAMVADGPQEPILRTVCDRIAFQESSNDLVRVSLDMHLHMVSEMGTAIPGKTWCRSEKEPLLPEEVVHFPYCVVEMKLKLEHPPEWLLGMVASVTLLHAPRFSKYLHGTAALFPNLVQKMPYWYLQNSDGTMSPATWDEMADESDNFYDQNAAPWLFPKKGDVPVMARLSSFFHRKLGIGGNSLALEAKDVQQQTEARTAKLESTKEAQQPAAARQAQWRAAPMMQPPEQPKVPQLEMLAAHILEPPPAAGQANPSHAHQEGSMGPKSARQVQEFTPRHSDIQEAPPRQSQPPAPGQQAQVDIEAPAAKLAGAVHEQEASPGKTWWAASLLAVQGRTAGGTAQSSKDGYEEDSNGDKRPKLVQGSYRSKTLVRTRVEPKTFFANERTFLAWLHIAVLIMLTGLTLLGGSFHSGASNNSCSIPAPPRPPKPPKHPPPPGVPVPPQQAPAPVPSTYNSLNCKASKYAGIVISPVAVLFMVYALYMYKKRTIQIMQQRKSARFDDQRGPVLLVIILVGALLVSMVITVRAVFETTG